MHLCCACRQAVGNDERDVVPIITCVLRKRRLSIRREAAAEVRTHQIVLPIFGGACDRKNRKSEPCEVTNQARLVERLMHRIAGAGMGELQVEQRLRRKGCAAPF